MMDISITTLKGMDSETKSTYHSEDQIHHQQDAAVIHQDLCYNEAKRLEEYQRLLLEAQKELEVISQHAFSGINRIHRDKAKNPSLRRVRFDSSVHVISIPCKYDYLAANLSDDLWWKFEDLISFKKEGKKEVRSIMKLMKVNFKTAICYLYQPQHDILLPPVPLLSPPPSKVHEKGKDQEQRFSIDDRRSICHSSSRFEMSIQV